MKPFNNVLKHRKFDAKNKETSIPNFPCMIYTKGQNNIWDDMQYRDILPGKESIST